MLGNLMFAVEAHSHTGLGLHEWSLIWSAMIVMAVILGTGLVARGQVGLVPRGLAAVYEHMFDWLESIASGFMGREGRNYVPLALSFFIYILMSNWMGLIPMPVWHYHEHGELVEVAAFESPTVSLSVTLALGLLAGLAYNLFGLRKALFPPKDDHGHAHAHDHGHGDAHAHGGGGGLSRWIARFWDPVPSIYRDLAGVLKALAVPLFFLFVLLNTIERVLPIASLSLRLYGNIFAKHTIRGSMYIMMEQMIHQGDFFSWGIFIVLLGSSCFVAVLGALAGFIQAMIFTVLLLSYIGHAVADEH